MAYNTTPHESTGLTPHIMVFGKEMKFPLDIITDSVEKKENEDFSTYVVKLEKILKEAHDVARKHIKMATKRQKQKS